MRMKLLFLSLLLLFPFLLQADGTPKNPILPVDFTLQIHGAWLRNIPDSKESDGFFLLPDGSLKLINIASMQANRWNITDNQFTMWTHTERYPTPQPDEYSVTKITDDKLYLKKNASEIIYHRPTYTTELTNTRWIAQNIPAVADSVRPEREPFLQFISVTELKGYGGCNQFRGSYTGDSSRLSVGPLMSTRMYCPAMGFEDAFTRAIYATDTYFIVEDKLYLYENSTLQAVLQANYYN